MGDGSQFPPSTAEGTLYFVFLKVFVGIQTCAKFGPPTSRSSAANILALQLKRILVPHTKPSVLGKSCNWLVRFFFFVLDPSKRGAFVEVNMSLSPARERFRGSERVLSRACYVS